MASITVIVIMTIMITIVATTGAIHSAAAAGNNNSRCQQYSTKKIVFDNVYYIHNIIHQRNSECVQIQIVCTLNMLYE